MLPDRARLDHGHMIKRLSLYLQQGRGESAKRREYGEKFRMRLSSSLRPNTDLSLYPWLKLGLKAACSLFNLLKG